MRDYAPLAVAVKLIRASFGNVGRIAEVTGAAGKFVTSFGFVFSVWKGGGATTWKLLRLRTMRHSRGYPQVNIRRNGKQGPVKVHTLVAEAFLPPPSTPRSVIRHRDDNPENNRPGNLRWGTQVQNVADAKRNGRRIGRPPVIADRVVRKVRRERLRGHTFAAIAKANGVSVTTACELCNGRKRKGVK